MEEEKKSLSTFLSDAEVKIVWREDSNLDKPPKVGRGKILNDDDNFVYLTGEKGTVIVNKKDIIAVKQLPVDFDMNAADVRNKKAQEIGEPQGYKNRLLAEIAQVPGAVVQYLPSMFITSKIPGLKDALNEFTTNLLISSLERFKAFWDSIKFLFK